MWHVNVIDEDRIVIGQRNDHIINPHRAGREISVEPDRDIGKCSVLRDAAVFALREIPNYVLVRRSVLAPLKPTWSTAPHDDKIERLVVPCCMTAGGCQDRR